MNTLPLEQHLALMLADIYSFKVKEIVEVLDKNEAVVKHLLHDARTTMQEIFDKRCALAPLEIQQRFAAEMMRVNRNPSISPQSLPPQRL